MACAQCYFDSYPTERGIGSTRTARAQRLSSPLRCAVRASTVESTTRDRSDHLCFEDLSRALYTAKVNGKWTPSLSHSSTFVVSQENSRHTEKYKMAPCYEHLNLCGKQAQLGTYNHGGRQHQSGTYSLWTFCTNSSRAHGHRNLCSDNCYSLHPGRWRVIGKLVQCIGSVKIRTYDRCVPRGVPIYSKVPSGILQSCEPFPSEERMR